MFCLFLLGFASISIVSLFRCTSNLQNLGLDNAGKTSLLHRMTTGSFKVFTPTQVQHLIKRIICNSCMCVHLLYAHPLFHLFPRVLIFCVVLISIGIYFGLAIHLLQRAREDSFQIASVNFKAWDLGGHEVSKHMDRTNIFHGWFHAIQCTVVERQDTEMYLTLIAIVLRQLSHFESYMHVHVHLIQTVRYLWEDFLPDCTAVVFMVCLYGCFHCWRTQIGCADKIILCH